jgi:hypothetical protein
MEPEGSIPNSQELPTCPYPEPDRSNPHHSIPHLQVPFYIILSPTSWSSYWPASLWLSHQQPICVSSSPPFVLHVLPSHHPRLHHSNYTWRRVQIMKLFIMQFSPFSCHFISLRLKNPPQHSVLKHPQSMFLS